MKKCLNCHREINDEDMFCPHCGIQQYEVKEIKKEKEIPLRKRSIALLLSFFLGAFGVDDYYLGYKNSFYIKFGLCLVSMGILAFPLILVGYFNFFRILFNKNFKDGYGRKLI